MEKKAKKKGLKKRIPDIIVILIFLIGFGIFAYPTVSDQWNSYRQSRLISGYDQQVNQLPAEDYDKMREEARNYNDSITMNSFGGDVFAESQEELRGTPYWSVMNIGGDGIMGYLSIPSIDQEIPIHHGTSDEVLQAGIGHMAGTKLPIGGESNHSVLAAHRGLPSARLFTDIDKLKNGDKFYIHVFDVILAYEVDLIHPMVDRTDLDTLTGAMQIEEGQDYVTLFTCTPYGVNSHRLLVRGHRVDYYGEESQDEAPVETMLKSIQHYYMLYFLLAAAFLILLALLVKGVKRFIKKPKQLREEEK